MGAGENKRRQFLGLLIRTTLERRLQVFQEVTRLSTPTKSFYIMVAISTIIAAYGLIADSTAVVIGAMLVAPLMGPIFGVALGLSTGHRDLLRSAALSEVWGVLLAVALGLLIGLVSLQLGFSSEIMARTQPTLYDIIIAVASGLAGAYALVDPKISPALPGVAIATALVPPLATCGLCLSAGRWPWALGAFLLFFANFLAIEIAAAFVFTVFGMVETQTHQAFTLALFLRRFGLSLGLLAIVAVFMTHTLMRLIAERRLSEAVEKLLSQELRSTQGAYLSDFWHEKRGDKIDVMAMVLTPQEFDPAHVAHLEARLHQQIDPRIHLTLRSLISRDVDRNGPVFIAEEEREHRREVERQTQFLSQASRALNDGLRRILGAQLVDLRRQSTPEETVVTAVVRTPMAIEPAQVGDLEKVLQRAVDGPVRLIVRSIVSRDTDRHGPVFIAEEELRQQAQVAKRTQILTRASQVLKEQLQRLPGAQLTDLRRENAPGPMKMTAVVQAPTVIEPGQVASLEQALRKNLGVSLHLTVRSLLIHEADSRRYLYKAEKAPPLTGEALKFHRRVEQGLKNQLRRQVQGASLTEFRYSLQNGRFQILAVARTPRQIEPWQVRRMERAFRQYVHPRTDLVVQSIVGTAASGSGYLASTESIFSP